MVDQQIKKQARSLEDEFFAAEDRRRLDAIKHEAKKGERRKLLAKAVGSEDERLLNSLERLEIEPETALAAAALVPLVAVAWADSRLDEPEREAILKAADEHGLKSGSPARAVLEGWLTHPPAPSLIEAWKHYAKALRDSLDDDERQAWREQTIGKARSVAEAAGGFLGLTSKISAAEQAVLDDLQSLD